MTHTEIQATTPGATIWDDTVKGLHVRRRGGEPAFYIFYRTRAGQQRRFKLGDFPTLSLVDARSVARDILTAVARGEDPKGSWNKSRQELTLQGAFNVALEKHWSREKYVVSGWKKEVVAGWKNHLSKTFGGRKLSSVTAPEIREWHEKYADSSPYAANRAKSILSRVYSFAEERGWMAPGSNPCSAVPDHPEVKRTRYAQGGEIPAVGKVLEREAVNHPAEVAYIYVLIFTGSRPRAIERCTLDNLERLQNGVGVLTFQGKSGREQVILPLQAMALLDKLPPDRETLTGIKFPRRFWEAVREEAGCRDLWARDWRRTFATVGLSNGLNLDGLGELLNHKDPETTRIYAKLLSEARVEMAAKIASKLETMLRQAG